MTSPICEKLVIRYDFRENSLGPSLEYLKYDYVAVPNRLREESWKRDET